MSREEAISLLTQVNKILVNSNSWLENTHDPLNMAFDMAIKALEQESTIDYRRAFKIACELLSGYILYGIDSDKIFEIMMQKDGLVSNDSYERYILNHLQELDHGQYEVVEK